MKEGESRGERSSRWMEALWHCAASLTDSVCDMNVYIKYAASEYVPYAMSCDRVRALLISHFQWSLQSARGCSVLTSESTKVERVDVKGGRSSSGGGSPAQSITQWHPMTFAWFPKLWRERGCTLAVSNITCDASGVLTSSFWVFGVSIRFFE